MYGAILKIGNFDFILWFKKINLVEALEKAEDQTLDSLEKLNEEFSSILVSYPYKKHYIYPEIQNPDEESEEESDQDEVNEPYEMIELQEVNENQSDVRVEPLEPINQCFVLTHSVYTIKRQYKIFTLMVDSFRND